MNLSASMSRPLEHFVLIDFIMIVFQALLELVHDIFEEQTSLENVVHKIMKRALSLLKCEKCSVLLLGQPVLGSSSAEHRAQVCESKILCSQSTYCVGVLINC